MDTMEIYGNSQERNCENSSECGMNSNNSSNHDYACVFVFHIKKKHFIMIETLKEIPLVGMLMYPGIMSTLNDPTIAMILGAYNISLKMIHSYSDYSGCYNNNMDRYWCNI
jgi:hypothetical protein